MGKYKIVFDRKACIGAAACVAAAPEFWKLQSDAKASIINGKKISKDREEMEFGEDKFERIKTSAEVCPVNCIHIIDLKTKEKII
jgi:ferredoxin